MCVWDITHKWALPASVWHLAGVWLSREDCGTFRRLYVQMDVSVCVNLRYIWREAGRETLIMIAEGGWCHLLLCRSRTTQTSYEKHADGLIQRIKSTCVCVRACVFVKMRASTMQLIQEAYVCTEHLYRTFVHTYIYIKSPQETVV